jgi:hypothetical protein
MDFDRGAAAISAADRSAHLCLGRVNWKMKKPLLVISGKKSFINNVEPEAMLRFERPLGVFRRQWKSPVGCALRSMCDDGQRRIVHHTAARMTRH